MTHGLFLFQIPAVFYQIGKECCDLSHTEREAFVKSQLEIRAFDTYHSLMWKEAEYTALCAFEDGYRHNGYSYR
jgi:hypothetical protein